MSDDNDLTQFIVGNDNSYASEYAARVIAEYKEARLRHTKIMGCISALLGVVSVIFAFSALKQYEQTSRANYSAQLARYEASKAAAETAKRNLQQIVSIASFRASGGGVFGSSVGPVNNILSDVQRLGSESQFAIQKLQDVQPPPPPPTWRLGWSFVSTAYAEGAPAEDRAKDKFAVLRQFLWFLMFVPLAAGVVGSICLASKREELVGFGTNLITSVVGYYFGAGVTVLTALTGP